MLYILLSWLVGQTYSIQSLDKIALGLVINGSLKEKKNIHP
jgi:hypothetical protein